MSTNFFLGKKGYKIFDFLSLEEVKNILSDISSQINKSIKRKEFDHTNIKYFHKKKNF